MLTNSLGTSFTINELEVWHIRGAKPISYSGPMSEPSFYDDEDDNESNLTPRNAES